MALTKMKRLKRGFAASVALAAAFTGVGIAAPPETGLTPVASASTGSVEFTSHDLRTPEAERDGRLLTNSTVRLNARVQIDRASDSSRVEFRAPGGLQITDIPGYCGANSSLSNRSEPSRIQRVTSTTWQSLPDQVLVCDLGATPNGYGNNVWFEARVRPELPPGHRLTVQAQVIADGQVVDQDSYADLPQVHSEARVALGPHSVMNNVSWPTTSYAGSWPMRNGNHSHPDTEYSGYFRISQGLFFTTPSIYGNQPLDLSRTEIVFDMDPNKVYFEGVTRTQPWRDRQARHGDAYEYYMPALRFDGTNSAGAGIAPSSNNTPESSYRGASSDVGFDLDPQTQTARLRATAIDLSGWTVPRYRVGTEHRQPMPNKEDAYTGPDFEILWSRNIEVNVPGQALEDLIPHSGGNRLNVHISSPSFRSVGIHGTNRPWTSTDSWSVRGHRALDGYSENRHFVSAPWASSPMNTPAAVFSTGMAWWQGLPGQTSRADGRGNVMPGQTFMWNTNNRITAPAGGAAAQYQCVGWDTNLSLIDPGEKYNPGAPGRPGSQAIQHRASSGGPVYISGSGLGGASFDDNLRFEVQYSNARPVEGELLTCESGNWYNRPQDVPGNNATKAREGIYTNVHQVRYMLVTDVPVRWSLNTVVPLTPTNANYRGEAWMWNSYSSTNYRTITFDSLRDARTLNNFFSDPHFDQRARVAQNAVSNRAEKVTMTNPLSMINVDVDTPVTGGHLAEVRVQPHSPTTEGPMRVRVELDEFTRYHETVSGPRPTEVGDGYLIYSYSDPSSADENPIVFNAVTIPNEERVRSVVRGQSRMTGEPERTGSTGNNDSATIRIDSSTPVRASLSPGQRTVDVHPFASGAGQTNNWTLTAGNDTAFFDVDVDIFLRMPQNNIGDTRFSHAQARAVLSELSSQGWSVTGSTQRFPDGSTVGQMRQGTYRAMPSNPSSINTVKLSRRLSANENRQAEILMDFFATSDGDRLGLSGAYGMSFSYNGENLPSFDISGALNSPVVTVSGGELTGTSWVDGTVNDHDGVMGRSFVGVPRLPVQLTGTTASGRNITQSVYSNSATTNGDGVYRFRHLPQGTYRLSFGSNSWMQDSEFTTFTVRGGDSAVGYSGNWSPNWSNQTTAVNRSVPAVGANSRVVRTNAGLIGDSSITVERGRSHDFGYREQQYTTVFTVTNDSDTYVENVRVVEPLTGPVSRTSASVSGPGSASVSGQTVTYTAGRLTPGQSATVTVNHTVATGAEEGDELVSSTSSEGTFYGFASGVTEAEDHTGLVAIPALSAGMSWTDSGSWMPSIDDPRTGWQTGNAVPDGAALVEPFDAEDGAIGHADAQSVFGPGESLTSHYTLTNLSEVVGISVQELLGQLTGVELDESIALSTRVLEPGESMTVDAEFVDALAQVEVDRNEAVAHLEAEAVAPRYRGDYRREVHNLADEITEAFQWDSWTVPFHRYTELALLGRAKDASGDGVLETDEQGLFTYTWINRGNLTLTDPRIEDATGTQPRFEEAFNGELAPGEQVRGRTQMVVTAFEDGLFRNVAEAVASAPLDTDEDPTASVATTLAERSSSGLDLTISLLDADGDGYVSLGETFSYDLLLRNNSPERYSEVAIEGPVQVTSGGVTYTLEVSFPEDFAGVLNPGDTVPLQTISVVSSDTESAAGYVDVAAGTIDATARATGVDSNGDTYVSNWAADTSGVFSAPLIVSAGDGAGAYQEAEQGSTTLYWTLGGIAAAVLLGLILLLAPARPKKKVEQKEVASV